MAGLSLPLCHTLGNEGVEATLSANPQAHLATRPPRERGQYAKGQPRLPMLEAVRPVSWPPRPPKGESQGFGGQW